MAVVLTLPHGSTYTCGPACVDAVAIVDVDGGGSVGGGSVGGGSVGMGIVGAGRTTINPVILGWREHIIE